MQVDHLRAAAARQLLDVGPEWLVCQSRRITGGYVVSGGRPVIGPRGGRYWHGVLLAEVFVSDVQLHCERERYEREHARCWTCGGDGQEWAGCRGKVPIWQRCTRCGGVGTPPPRSGVELG